MNDTSAALNRDVKCAFNGHVWNHQCRISVRTIFFFKVFGGPSGLFGVSHGAADTMAILQKLLDDMRTLEAVRCSDEDERIFGKRRSIDTRTLMSQRMSLGGGVGSVLEV